MNFDDFIVKYYNNSTSVKKQDIKRFLQYVTEVVGERDIATALSDSNFLCRFFFLQKSNSISRSHYQKIKEYLCNLLDYYNVNTHIPSRVDVINSQEMTCYFKDLTSILNFVDYVGSSVLPDYDKHCDLTILKSIVVLGWYGFSSKEIIEMPKGNLEYGEPCKVFKLSYPVDGQSYVEISTEAFLILSELEALEEYKGLPSGKLQILKGNPSKLFRSVRDTQDDIDEGYIMQVIKRFNKIVPVTQNVAINFKNLNKNARFVAIYEDKSDDTLLTKITRYMKCSKNAALNYRDQYCKWVETYHK